MRKPVKTYTVVTDHETYRDLTAEGVADRVRQLRGYEEYTVKVQRPAKVYDVFYGHTPPDSDRYSFGWQGWTQHSTSNAANHFEAVVDRASRSQHQDGVRYLVVGPEYAVYSDVDQQVGRVFEINRVDTAEEAHFTCSFGASGTRHYTATEIHI